MLIFPVDFVRVYYERAVDVSVLLRAFNGVTVLSRVPVCS